MKNALSNRNLTALGVIAAVVLGFNGVAGADAIGDGITAAQTTLTGYVTAGVAMVIAILMLGVGIRTLTKWVKRAASAG